MLNDMLCCGWSNHTYTDKLENVYESFPAREQFSVCTTDVIIKGQTSFRAEDILSSDALSGYVNVSTDMLGL